MFGLIKKILNIESTTETNKVSGVSTSESSKINSVFTEENENNRISEQLDIVSKTRESVYKKIEEMTIC